MLIAPDPKLSCRPIVRDVPRVSLTVHVCVCARLCMRACACVCTGCPATTVHCPQGPHKFNVESVNSGYYEVVGTLQNNGTITEMNTISMGDNVGTCAKALAHFAHWRTYPMRSVDVARPVQIMTCALRDAHADMGMYAEMVKLTHQFPEVF